MRDVGELGRLPKSITKGPRKRGPLPIMLKTNPLNAAILRGVGLGFEKNLEKIGVKLKIVLD